VPAPMLARSGPLPVRGRWAFEPKWDGFRALVSTVDGLRVRSRRGWDMTPMLPELAALPARGVFDGELVAFGGDGLPSFPLVCRRLLQRDGCVPLVFIAFDVLELEAAALVSRPYAERRARLEALNLAGPAWLTSPVFDDGEALWAVVRERGLEGIVAKRRSERYRPGERSWVKVKNRAYWRFPLELEAVRRTRRDRVTI